MKTTKLLLCAVGLAAALVSAKVHAQQLTATLVEINPGMPVNGTVDGSFYQDWASGVADFGDFEAFCVEPLQGLSYAETVVYQIQDPGTLVNSDVVAHLVGGYLASPRTAADAAAVQWAIWEATTETSLSEASLFTGNVLITAGSSATATLANLYLANAGSFTPATLTFLTHPERQDVITWEVIPEPGVTGLAALSAFALLRRRR